MGESPNNHKNRREFAAQRGGAGNQMHGPDWELPTSTPSPICAEAALPGRHQRPEPPAPNLTSLPSCVFRRGRTRFRVTSFKRCGKGLLKLPALLLAPCAHSSAMSRMTPEHSPGWATQGVTFLHSGRQLRALGPHVDNGLEPSTQALGRPWVALDAGNGTKLSGSQGQVCFPKHS